MSKKRRADAKGRTYQLTQITLEVAEVMARNRGNRQKGTKTLNRRYCWTF